MDNDRLERIRTTRRTLALHGPLRSRSDGDFERVSIPRHDGDVLRDLLLAETAHTVIEIGLAYGSSALAVAEALVAGGSGQQRHVIIDAYQNQFYRSGWSALVEAGVADQCFLIEQRSQMALPELVHEAFRADAAFVDGSHIFHNVFVDLFYLGELVRPSGLIILDDCIYPSVAAAVRYFQLNAAWKPLPISASTRLCAFRLPDARIEPDFEHFKPFC